MNVYRIIGIGTVLEVEAVSPEVAEAIVIEQLPNVQVEQMMTRRIR
jgi:3-methyladenine DNA glycosylase Mpg